MIAPAPRRRFTFRDYLDLEEASNVKHEYFAGEIYAMASGSGKPRRSIHSAVSEPWRVCLSRFLKSLTRREISGE